MPRPTEDSDGLGTTDYAIASPLSHANRAGLTTERNKTVIRTAVESVDGEASHQLELLLLELLEVDLVGLELLVDLLDELE